jgi:hypothetical protein
MRMYFCTFPHMRALKILCAASLLAALGLPLSAQNARPQSDAPQAELRVKVIVVPAVAHHGRDTDWDRDEAAVTYDLKPQHEGFSITEEVRPMLVDAGNNAVRQEQVRIITVVPK